MKILFKKTFLVFSQVALSSASASVEAPKVQTISEIGFRPSSYIVNGRNKL